MKRHATSRIAGSLGRAATGCVALALIAGAALAPSSFAAAPSAAPRIAAAAACSDVEVLFARGTGERAGLGSVGTPLVSAITRALVGKTVSSYAVNYAADFSQRSAGPGATDMTRHLQQTAGACPSTRFVLSGYSQGATVTDIALGIRTGTTTGESVPAALAPRVVAVTVFGNPLGLSGGRTIRTSSAVYGARSTDYCNSSDSVRLTTQERHRRAPQLRNERGCHEGRHLHRRPGGLTYHRFTLCPADAALT